MLFRKGTGCRSLWIVAGLAPAVVTVAVLFAAPLIVAIVQSLGHAPMYGVQSFPTLEYYSRVVRSSRFQISVVFTLYYAILPTILSTILGTALAIAFSRHFPGRQVFRFFLRLPIVVPYLVGAALVVALLANGGIIARILHALGIITGTSDFPRILFSSSGWGIMLVYLFKQIPFTFLVISAVLAGIGPEYEEAARTLGATPRQAVRYILLPRLVPGIVTASLLVFAFNFQSYEIPYLLGSTFPSTLPVEAMRRFNLPAVARRPEAMAYVVVITALSGIILYTYLRAYRGWERRRGGVG